MQPPNPTVVFPEPGRVVVEDVSIPIPGSDELLIRTHCSLISIGTELSVLEGQDSGGQVWSEMRDYPFRPGYCNVGTVQSVGDEVDSKWIGQRVASWGNHGAFVTIDIEHCWPVPEGRSDEEAAFLVLFHVAANGVRRSGLTMGETAVVYGLGIIGQLTARLCHITGARPVFGIDVSRHRVDLLGSDNGLTGIVAVDSDPKEVIAAATRGRLADVVFEVTANATLIPKELEVLRTEGRFVIVSSPREATHFDFHDLCNRPSFTIIGAHNWSHPKHAGPQTPWTMQRHAEMYFGLIGTGDLDVLPLISHRITVEESPEFYQQLMHDRTDTMGAIIRFPDV